MSDLDMARKNPEELLWKQLDSVHAGMLGVQGSGQLLQPMAHFSDREGRRLWFLTKRDTDLFHATHPGARAEFVIISKAQDFHASIEGAIAENADRAMLDRIWNPVSSGWFKGKDDPELAMLALSLERAAIWASTASTLAFAWEVAKANVTDSEPNMGVRNEVDFV